MRKLDGKTAAGSSSKRGGRGSLNSVGGDPPAVRVISRSFSTGARHETTNMQCAQVRFAGIRCKLAPHFGHCCPIGSRIGSVNVLCWSPTSPPTCFVVASDGGPGRDVRISGSPLLLDQLLD